MYSINTSNVGTSSSILSSGTQSITITVPGTGSNTYLTTTYGGGGGGGASWASTGYSMISTGTTKTVYDTSLEGKLVIKTGDGKNLDVGMSLEKIMEVLGIMLPDQALLGKYPALKLAYDEYDAQLKKAYMNPELRSAMDGYRTMEALVKAGSNDDI